MADLESFVTKTLGLLEKEREAEIDETRILTEKLPAKELQNRGVCLLKLRLVERRSGLYGRTVVTFEPFWTHNNSELPSHNISPGDIVGVSLSQGEGNSECLASGIVSRVGSQQISVAFDETTDVFTLSDEEQYKLLKLANDVTYKRLRGALKDLNKYNTGRCGNLINVLFGVSSLSPPSQAFDLEFFNENLDPSQKEAVRFSLLQKELAVIHGPPGTGKTTTVIEVILQAVKQGLKVLACAPSNIAVDNLVERLSRYRKKIVRLGHPARLLPSIQPFALDAIVSNSESTRIVEDVRRELDTALSKMKNARNRKGNVGVKEEIKLLRKELRQRGEAATREILTKADVVLVTLTSATNDGPLKFIDKDHFDLVVIDENSQALEAACWIGLLRAPRCILAGDHHQLPPTIMSKQAEKEGLGESLMERILKQFDDEVVRMLTVQYRMNQAIMQWSSDQLYHGKLTAHSSVKSHLLRDLPHVIECDETKTALLLIDTAGCDMYELDLPEEISKGNEGEAKIVASHVEKLISCGLTPDNIAVIAPYNLQVDIIRGMLSSKYPKLEIRSVDGFQGREKEAVIISCVRSNTTGEVGFLAENRRMNVAVTRARRHLALICDSETISHDQFLRSMVQYFNHQGEVWSAHQYTEGGEVHHSYQHKPSSSSSSKTVPDKHTKHNKPEKSKKNTEEEDKKKKEKFRNQLTEFVNDTGSTVLTFPASLNSHDRLLVHQLCEELGLCHESKGEGKERCLQVRKTDRNNDSENIDSGTPSDCSVEGSKGHNSQLDREGNSQSMKGDNYQSNKRDNSEENKGENSQESKGINSQSKEGDNSQGNQGDKFQSNKGNNSHFQENKGDKSGSIPNNSATVNDSTSGVIVKDVKQLLNKDGDKDENKTSLRKPSDNKITCHRCKKDVIVANLDLHEVHCYRQGKASNSTSQPHTDKSTIDKSTNSAKKKEKRDNKVSRKKEDTNLNRTSKALDKVDSSDFDALLETVNKLDKRCAFRKCKELTQTLGQTCDFCKQRFCFEHYVPEVHGCGDEAKTSARKTMIRDGVIHRGSGAPDKKLDPDKKAHLQRKLDKKLEDFASKRTTKKPSAKKR